jgi:hypothetical protein
MNRWKRPVRRLVLLTAPVALVMSVVSPAHAAAPGFTTVVSGLRNPRGLDFSANGTLYVAEGGVAGDVCFPGAETEEGGPLCGGTSGRISQVDVKAGTRSDFITGLASIGGPLFAIGPSGVGVQGNQVFAILGANDVAVPPSAACGDTDACRAFLATASAQLGHVLRGVPSGKYAWQQDVGQSNFAWTVANKDTVGAGDPAYQGGPPSWVGRSYADNPDFAPGDSNAYGMANAPGGTYVVDGGSNTLTWVPHQGSPQVLVAFPNPADDHANAYDAVATCVAPIRGGWVVVADLNGDIFEVDGSSLTTAPSAVGSEGGAFLAAAGGCAYDGHGNVYISDIFVGSVVKLSLSTLALSWVLPPGTLNFPSGVAIAKNGAVYVTNNGVCPDFPLPAGSGTPCDGVTGSIVRIG